MQKLAWQYKDARKVLGKKCDFFSVFLVILPWQIWLCGSYKNSFTTFINHWVVFLVAMGGEKSHQEIFRLPMKVFGPLTPPNPTQPNPTQNKKNIINLGWKMVLRWSLSPKVAKITTKFNIANKVINQIQKFPLQLASKANLFLTH